MPAEFGVEAQFEQPGNVQTGQGIGFFGQEGQAEGRVFRPEEFARMRLEGEHGERRIRPRGMGRPQHRRVAEMHPVEIAERHRGTARLGGHGIVWTDYVESHAVVLSGDAETKKGRQRHIDAPLGLRDSLKRADVSVSTRP
jgi:hypothetical protein